MYLPGVIHHPKQLAFLISRARYKVLRAGRRGGKTVASATEAVLEFLGLQLDADGSYRVVKDGGRVLYISPTAKQVRRFWYEVKAALKPMLEANIYYLNETQHLIEVPGTRFCIQAMTGWNPSSLRGDNADLLIFDEYQLMDETVWEKVGAPMLMDTRGRAIFIYTPPSLHSEERSNANDPRHAAKLYKKAAEDTTGEWATFHFSSQENPYLPPGAVDDMSKVMTRLAYEQEILALDRDEAPGAFWNHALIDAGRVDHMPELSRLVIGVDPPGGIAECGIVVVGKGIDGHYYIVGDFSLQGSPGEWAGAVIHAYREFAADRVVAEKNFGGEMVEHTIRTAKGGRDIPVQVVTAYRGKALRAEPVASLYERGLVHHVGSYPYLEDQMCTWEADAKNQKSPDRLDAMVHGVSYLLNTSSKSLRRVKVQGLYASQQLRYTKGQRSPRVRGHETPQE
jgi:phage terminase large subunit-like protein